MQLSYSMHAEQKTTITVPEEWSTWKVNLRNEEWKYETETLAIKEHQRFVVVYSQSGNVILLARTVYFM